ncbi:MAG: hypothetical protein ABR543_08365 [Gemmatimonadaceae bacterium]
MQMRSGRQVAGLWVGAILILVASAWGSQQLLPRTAGPTTTTSPPASYYVGLLGLLAIGIALMLTWSWVRTSGPASRGARSVVQALLAVGTALWVAAMVFPFL